MTSNAPGGEGGLGLAFLEAHAEEPHLFGQVRVEGKPQVVRAAFGVAGDRGERAVGERAVEPSGEPVGREEQALAALDGTAAGAVPHGLVAQDGAVHADEADAENEDAGGERAGDDAAAGDAADEVGRAVEVEVEGDDLVAGNAEDNEEHGEGDAQGHAPGHVDPGAALRAVVGEDPHGGGLPDGESEGAGGDDAEHVQER